MNEILLKEFEAKTMSAGDALNLLKEDDTIYIGTGPSIAYGLLEALWDRREEFKNVNLAGGLIIKSSEAVSTDWFKLKTYFIGSGDRKRKDKDRIDFSSIHLSQTDIWCRKTARPTVAFFEVSLPDETGYMSYGASGVSVAAHVNEIADRVILQVNKNTPYVYGDKTLIHVSEADAIVYYDSELPEAPKSPEDETINYIADFLREKIHDGSCIQLGIGSIANAVGYRLKDKNDLGAHTEIMSDSIMELMKTGVLNNSHKSFLHDKTATSVAFGSRELYEFLNNNKDMHFMPLSELNDPVCIARNDNMVSINNAIAIDLFGQVSSETISGRQYSGTGGQLDYVKGAQMSKGGASFIALQSTIENRDGSTGSRIVSEFPPRTAITTPRTEVQYVVTEYGCVNLKPLTMRDRVNAMISLAHPDFRPSLKEEAKSAGIL